MNYAVFSLLALLSLSQALFGLMRDTTRVDFSVYYGAARETLEGRNPYARLYDGIPFNYPPTALLFFLPFAMLPFPISTWIYTTLSLCALFGTCFAFLKGTAQYALIRWLVIPAVFLQLFPAKFTLTLGQINLMVLFLLALSFWASQKKQSLFSGLLWAAAGMIKITPLILGFYFLLKKDYRAFAAGIGGILLVSIVMHLSVPSSDTFYITMLPSLLLHAPPDPSVYDQSLRAFLSRLDISHPSLIAGTITIVLCIAALWKHHRNTPENQSSFHDLSFFSLLLGIATIGASFAWQHHFVFFIPGFMAAAFTLPVTPKPRRILHAGLLGTSMVLVGFHFPDPAHLPTGNPLLLSHTLLGALLCIGLLFTRKTG